MTISDFLIARLLEWDPDFDVTATSFVREVLDPLKELVGENTPQTDPQALVRARLGEEFPDIDGTAFGDLVGKALGTLIFPALTEVRAAVNRRRLDNELLLTQTDLKDLRDVFLVDPSTGTYSTGTFKVFYASPRSLRFTPSNRIVVLAEDGSELVYRPVEVQVFTLQEVRLNREGSTYFVEVSAVATNPGSEYNISAGAARGATGFPGSVRVNNPNRFSGGAAADDSTTFLDRIRTSVRTRSWGSPAGAENRLENLNLEYSIVRPGDSRMVRDRIYGPATISGIPGGFLREPPPVPAVGDEPFVRIGIAFDIWVASADIESTVGVDVGLLYDEGVETLDGFDGQLSFDSAQPANQQYTLQTRGFRFEEIVGVPAMTPGFPGALRPIAVGDIFQVEGLFSDPGIGARLEFEVTVVVDGGEVRLNPLTPIDPTVDPGWTSIGGTAYRYSGSRYKALRRVYALVSTSDTEAGRYAALSVPITDARALDTLGNEIEASGQPALPKPGSTEAEFFGTVVPRTRNVIADAELLPVVDPLRVELLDAISGSETARYLYSRRHLYAEFLQSTSGDADEKAVLLRIHTLGPQMVSLASSCVVTNESETLRMTPIVWLFNDVVTIGDDAETDQLQIDAGDSLSDFLEVSVSGGAIIEGRIPSAGDVAMYFVAGQPPYILPITAINVVDGILTVAAPDIPTGLTGTLEIAQGASRQTMLTQGRTPEGTYFVDIWMQEATDYTPGDPPLSGTQAFIDETRYICQGFDYVGAVPGQEFSVAERASLILHGGYGNDGEQLSGRSIRVHTTDASSVEQVQDILDEDSSGAQTLTGLAKRFAPAYVVLTVYYDAVDLEPSEASPAIESAFEQADTDDRFEISDLTAALYELGADFAVTGRVFVLRQDELRRWRSFATKDAVSATSINQFVLHTVQIVRLDREKREDAQRQDITFDVTDTENWLSSDILRAGGFNAD